jgi:pimeloyl-ACP methyl ester carboxylesterase
MTTPTGISPAQLPATIRGYLAAHAARETDAALRAFTPTALVVDEGHSFRGQAEIVGFLEKAGAQFSYTTELIGAERIDDARWVATNRLTGDFPGGVADLDYRFTMSDDLIALLVIAPRSTDATATDSTPTDGTPTEGTPTHGTKPTVVLVHGAFADSSSWNGVIAPLRKAGYPVIAVANPLRALDRDADFLRTVLDSVEGPIVLAGHSYGGSVMSEAADANQNVKALVYVASFLLDAGESTAELAARFAGGELGTALHPVSFTAADGATATDLYIRQDDFQRVFAADVAPEVASLMAVTQRPIVADALEGKATRAAWKTIPSWTLVTRQDLAIPADSMRFMAERAGSRTVEIDASHAVTVSQPRAVAELIDEAARATAG